MALVYCSIVLTVLNTFFREIGIVVKSNSKQSFTANITPLRLFLQPSPLSQCDALITPGSDTASSFGDNSDNTQSAMALTKTGTLPSVAAVWSDGSVSLHAITADIVSSATSGTGQQHRAKKTTQKSLVPALEMRQLWRVYPFELGSQTETIGVNFDELGITFESGAIYGGIASSNDNQEKKRYGDNGAILLGGRYTLVSKERVFPLKFSFHALDAMTGTSLWELKGNHESGASQNSNKGNSDMPFTPIIHLTSSARRRSHLPTEDTMDPDLDNENAFIEGDSSASEECMAHYRGSVLDRESGALPHQFWENGELGSIDVGRFDRKKKMGIKNWKTLRRKGQNYLLKKHRAEAGVEGSRRDATAVSGLGGMGQTGRTRARASKGNNSRDRRRELDGGAQDSSWQSDLLHRAVPHRLIQKQKYNAQHPHKGKPNVVLFHGRDGLAVLSLKNGRRLCHISLTDRSLYADMDGDGVIDIVQVVTSSNSHRQSNSGVQSLIHRIAKSSKYQSQDAPVICHALVTSGFPPREEVFTAPLCLGGPINSRALQHLSAAPPLLLEGSLGYGSDVVFAMNNGVVVRYDFNGNEIWRKKGGLNDGIPSWESDSPAAFLGRIQFGLVRKAHSSVSASSHGNQHRPGSPVRPILLSGDDGAALISPATGRILCSVAYPQSVVSQPILVDFDGDGTDDLLVVSDDAIWGYRVIVETGESGGFTIIVVTLLIGVALAALVHRQSHGVGQSSRRSTDAC